VGPSEASDATTAAVVGELLQWRDVCSSSDRWRILGLGGREKGAEGGGTCSATLAGERNGSCAKGSEGVADHVTDETRVPSMMARLATVVRCDRVVIGVEGIGKLSDRGDATKEEALVAWTVANGAVMLLGCSLSRLTAPLLNETSEIVMAVLETSTVRCVSPPANV
jgi:hypothetical protein